MDALIALIRALFVSVDQEGGLAVLLGGEASIDSVGASEEGPGRVTAAGPAAEQGAQAAAAADLPPSIGTEQQQQQRDGEVEVALENAVPEQQQQEQQPGADEMAEEELERLLPEELRQAPEGQCDPAVQARVANWLHLQRTRGR